MKKKQIITIAALIFLFAAIPSVANGAASPSPGSTSGSCTATCRTVGNGQCSKDTEGWRCACTKGSCTSGYAECHAVSDPNCHVSTSGATPTPAPASCQTSSDCGLGLICYSTTVCTSGGNCTTTLECRKADYVPVPTGGFPPGPDGLWHCSGCSNIYNSTFARWTSTTGDCESGIVEGSQEYTPSCGCSTPGKPQFSGSTEDCSPSGVPLFVCSGCDMLSSTQRMFVTWLSRFPDCSDKIVDPVNGIKPVYTQDLSCATYAPARATPIPSPRPEGDFCTLWVSNNPCQITNWTNTGLDRCATRVNWEASGDIQIYFQTGGMRQTQQVNPRYLDNTATMNPNLVQIGGSYNYLLASDTGDGNRFFQVEVGDVVNLVGVVNGEVMCTTQVTAVRPSGEITIPSPPPLDCRYEADGRTPICPYEVVPCMPWQTTCGAFPDACGCYSIPWCADGRHANCNEADDDRKASESLGGSAKAKGDVNGDGKVDMADIGIFFTNYRSAKSVADVNGDGKVDIFDYNMLVGNFGK